MELPYTMKKQIKDTGSWRVKAAIGLLAFVAPIAFWWSVPGVPPVQRAVESTWLVTSTQGEGTAIAISETRLLTAAHVVRGCSSVVLTQVISVAGKKIGAYCITADVIGTASATDVAILRPRTAGAIRRFVSPAKNREALPAGSEVFHVGNFYGSLMPSCVSRGIVSRNDAQASDPQCHWKTVDQTTALAIGGSSGGGLFNADGELVGIVVGTYDSVSGIGFFVPLRAISI